MVRPTSALVRRDQNDVVRRDLETRLMDESRQLSSLGVGAALRKAAPPPALCGFLLLLVLIFSVSYAVGVGAGPVAPGMHGTGGTSGVDGTGGSSGTGGGAGDVGGVSGGSGDMGDMGDMDMQGGHG
ncbi:hypothetical protein [Streptomyces sp. NBC_01451]|uniref:hypothetical protein n=1 Tax=Streptomyces sp. NBC_01451 TaxID=2903872 RepID=UPI003FCDDE36